MFPMKTKTEPSYLYMNDVPISDFTDFSHAVRRKDTPLDSEDWREAFAEGITDELNELYKQHGPFEQLLDHGSAEKVQEVLQQHPEIREWVLDELSDMLWFDVMAARVSGFTPEGVANYALQARRINLPEQLETFDDIQNASIEYASKLKMTDLGELFDKNNPHPKITDRTLKQDPAWVYHEMTSELVYRFLDWETEYLDMQYSLGSHLLALGYVSKVCLDFDLKDLARYNSYKLVSRRKFGKKATHFFK
jgi:hypothetical protein